MTIKGKLLANTLITAVALICESFQIAMIALLVILQFSNTSVLNNSGLEYHDAVVWCGK